MKYEVPGEINSAKFDMDSVREAINACNNRLDGKLVGLYGNSGEKILTDLVGAVDQVTLSEDGKMTIDVQQTNPKYKDAVGEKFIVIPLFNVEDPEQSPYRVKEIDRFVLGPKEQI